MVKVMSQQHASNKVHRSACDLAHHLCYSAKAGEILPIFSRPMLPGQNIRGPIKGFVRTRPLLAPAFTQIRQYTEFYFVPMRLIWRWAHTFYGDAPDQAVEANGILEPPSLNPEYMPFVTVKDVVDYLNTMLARIPHGNYRPTSTYIDQNNPFGFHRVFLTCKLLQYLGYDAFGKLKYTDGNTPYKIDDIAPEVLKQAINLNDLLCYQKVCDDWHRNSQWLRSQPHLYNVSYLPFMNGSSEPTVDDYRIPINTLIKGPAPAITPKNLFDMNYAYNRKDLFFGQIPNSQYGEQSYIPVDSNKVGILNFRFANAAQKLREIQISNDRDYVSQMEAIFDAKPSKLLKNKSIPVGSFHQDINITPQFNTNLDRFGSDAPSAFSVPDACGIAEGSGSGYINYTAQEHGYLIGVTYFIPQQEYNLDGFTPFQLETTRQSLCNPVFDSLGYERLPIEIISARFHNNLLKGLGYVPRYAPYKTAINRVVGDFKILDGGKLYGWTAPFDLSAYYDVKNKDFRLTDQSFRINPHITDSLFRVAADSTSSTDPFICSFQFDFRTILPLKENGLPY